MNPSTALATVLVDELIRGGVREAVLAPGSRSAPIAYALHAADAAGRLRLHVRLDERSAAFTALGLAKASQRPVPVLTTSGTAAANLHPAVLEASHAGVPLLALTADRPPELRGTGANQTVDQMAMFGSAVRAFHHVGLPEERAGSVAYWRALVCRMLAAATGVRSGDPGPIHLNLPFREPLVPDAGPWVEPLDGRPDGSPWTAVDPTPSPAQSRSVAIEPEPRRTVVVVGDAPPAWGHAAVLLAEECGWPVISEPSGNARVGPNVLQQGHRLLDDLRWVAAHRPERVLVVGRPTLWRSVLRLMREPGVRIEIASPSPRWADAVRLADRVYAAVPEPPDHRLPDREWVTAWRQADADLVAATDHGTWSGPVVAETLMDALPPGALLTVSSSLPGRELAWSAPREGVTVMANRGAAGIDGVTSTAIGAALAWQAVGGAPAACLIGDTAFLHDAAGLVLGPHEPRPDLAIVVTNNGGGRIFRHLEQGAPQHAAAFDRLFANPHGADLGALAAAAGLPYFRVAAADELRSALNPALLPGAGLHIIEATLT